ncbi:unnamed protein product [Pedinophyceae sp. YPF-701]|nr:unnamed protein product [Pedinophyceae sp. YPF-701]
MSPTYSVHDGLVKRNVSDAWQDEFRAAVEAAGDSVARACPSLVSLLARGSVANGTAAAGISDLDLFGYAIVDTDGLDDEAAARTARAVGEVLTRRCASAAEAALSSAVDGSSRALTKTELLIFAVPSTSRTGAALRALRRGDAITDAQRGDLIELPMAFELATQAKVVAGVDLGPHMPAKARAVPPPGDLHALADDVRAALDAGHEDAMCGRNESACRAHKWALKRVLRWWGRRACSEASRAGKAAHFARDLFHCARLASAAYPALERTLCACLLSYVALPTEAAVPPDPVIRDFAAARRACLSALSHAEQTSDRHSPAHATIPSGSARTEHIVLPPRTLSSRLRAAHFALTTKLRAQDAEFGAGWRVHPLQPVRTNISGSVEEIAWGDEASMERVRAAIATSDPADGGRVDPLHPAAAPVILRAAAASWRCVHAWTEGGLLGVFGGKSAAARVSPGPTFRFSEPALVARLKHLSRVTEAPSLETRLPFTEAMLRVAAAPSPGLPPVAYGDEECCYVQAVLPDRALADIDLAAEPFATLSGGTSCGVQQRVSQAPRLWMSGAGTVTSLHYDRSFSALVQVRGTKRLLFFPPQALADLEPYPDDHIQRRRCRYDPTETSKAAGRDVGCWEAVLGPGDVVMFGPYWAHYTESVTASMSVTCRFDGLPR